MDTEGELVPIVGPETENCLSNDLSNAAGPFSVIYHVWSTGQLSGSNTDTPVWILVFLALVLVIGLATYGYNVSLRPDPSYQLNLLLDHGSAG